MAQSETVKKKKKQKGAQGQTDMRSRRLGALDRMAAKAPQDVQGRLQSMQDKTNMLGTAGGGQPQPALVGPPVGTQDGVVSTQYSAAPQMGGAAPPQQYGAAPMAGGAPAPMPAPVPGQGTSLAQAPPVAAEPQPYGEIDPATGQMVTTAPPATYGAAPQMQPPQAVGSDDQYGAAPQMGMTSMPPATQDEAVAQANLDEATAKGQLYNTQPTPVAPPEQFFNNRLGMPGMQTPRDLERIRRKRLALLSPEIQQLRPAGRGLPQIRYQGQGAYPGALSQPPQAGWGRPTVRDPRQPMMR